MSARIEMQVECGSCDRIEWCGLFLEEDHTGRNDELVIDAPEGWYVGPASRAGTPIVHCPDHNALRPSPACGVGYPNSPGKSD